MNKNEHVILPKFEAIGYKAGRRMDEIVVPAVKPMDIILFGSNGKTFRFSGVTDFVESDTSYTFKYFGLSTQTYRFAKFDKPQIVGMSTLNKDQEENNNE